MAQQLIRDRRQHGSSCRIFDMHHPENFEQGCTCGQRENLAYIEEEAVAFHKHDEWKCEECGAVWDSGYSSGVEDNSDR